MANFKKGIALALVATTAFTFAPVATFAAPASVDVTKLTTTTGIDSISFEKVGVDTGKNVEFSLAEANNMSSDKTYVGAFRVSTADEKIATIATNNAGDDKSIVANDGAATAIITGVKAGTTTVKIESLASETSSTALDTTTLTVTVSAASDTVTLSKSAVTLTATNQAAHPEEAVTYKLGGNVKSVEATSYNADVATVAVDSANKKIKITAVADGATQIAVSGKDAENHEIWTGIITVNVVSNTANLSVSYEGKDYTKQADIAPIALNLTSKKTAQVNAVAGVADANIEFKSKNPTYFTVSNTGLITALKATEAGQSDDNKIEVTATSRSNSNVTEKFTIPVTVTNNEAATLSVNDSRDSLVADTLYLSLTDRTSDTLSVKSNVSAAYIQGKVENSAPKEAGKEVISWNNGTITALNEGTADVTVSVLANPEKDGTVGKTIHVVVNKLSSASVVTAEGVSVSKAAPTARIDAKASLNNLVQFDTTFYKKNEDGTFTEDTSVAGNLTISNVGKVTYTAGHGVTYARCHGLANATSNPTPYTYVPVTYADVLENVITLDKARVDLTENGETATVVAKATYGKTVLTATSDKTDVATVAITADGSIVVTPVAAGTAVVTVAGTLPEKDASGYAVPQSVSFTVSVAAKEVAPKPVVIAKPAKVKSVTAKAVKGGKVKFTAKKVANAAGYQFVYTVGKKTVKKTTTKTTLTVKIGKGKKATVKVRAYNYKNGTTKQYGAFSAKKSVKASK